MRIRIVALSALLILSSAGPGSVAASDATETPSKSAGAQAESVTDANQYLANLDQTLGMARHGDYGRLKRGSEVKLQAVREHIANLLKDHASTSELRPDDRIALANAQEEIKSIINNQEKDRMVCRSEAPTGTRFPTTECMTVGEREGRARAAGEGLEKFRRGECIPNETNTCGR